MKNQQTILLLILLALVILCAGLAIAYTSASSTSNGLHGKLVRQFSTEVQGAKTAAGKLLPTSGSKLETEMAAVRMHLHAAKILNEMARDNFGSELVFTGQTLIDNCERLWVRCTDLIQTGMVVSGTFSELNEAIDQLIRQMEP